MRKKLLVFLSLFLFIFLSFNCQAEVKGFSINPFFQELNLEKNQSEVSFFLEISNNTEKSAVFKLSVLDFGALNESGGVAFLGSSENQKYSLASWVDLEKDALVVDPGKKQKIKVTIKNKESLSPGGHYAAVVLKAENEENFEGGNFSEVDLNLSLASLIFARKIGGEKYGLELKNIEIEQNFLQIPFFARLRFQNTGNVHLIPRGIVEIADPLKRVVARGIINEGSALVLPEAFRAFPIKIQKSANAFIPGKYTVSIKYRFDSQDEFVQKKQKIVLIPFLFVLICLITGGLLAGYIWLNRRQKQRKKD